MLLRRGGSPLPPRNAALQPSTGGNARDFCFWALRRFGLCAGKAGESAVLGFSSKAARQGKP